MTDPTPEPAFDELAMRSMDGRASEAELRQLGSLITGNELLAREYASLARFEFMLRQRCQRDARALLEFVALEAAMAEEDVSPVPVAKEPARKRAFPWLSLAATVVVLAGLASYWLNRPSEQAPLMMAVVSGKKAAPSTVTLLAPRSATGAASKGTLSSEASHAAETTLAERLDDYFLPSTKLNKTTLQNAAEQLTAQLREHNYAQRTDLDALRIKVPSQLAAREVTLATGPVSFAKAVKMVSELAGGNAVISSNGIQIEDRGTEPAVVSPLWQTLPWNVAESIRQADALGIVLTSRNSLPVEREFTKVQLPAGQFRALETLAASQKQLDALEPLSLVPVVVPSSVAGKERLLTAQEAVLLKQQLGLVTPASVPVVKLPFGSTGSSPSLALPGGGLVTLSVVPVGEMNQVTIQTTSEAGKNEQNYIAAVTAPPPPPAQIATTPPAVSVVLREDAGGVLLLNGLLRTDFTPEGLPLPEGFVYYDGAIIPVEALPDSVASLLLLPP